MTNKAKRTIGQKLYDFFIRFTPSYMIGKMNSLGVKYSAKEMVFQIVGLVGGTVAVGFLSKLNAYYIVILAIIAFLCSPSLIIAWFNQAYNFQRFYILIDYLTNIVPIFMRRTKILYALTEVEDLVYGYMRVAVRKAINYLNNSGDDPELYENALAIIEKEFPNSRVRAVHKMMIAIERNVSRDYETTCTYLMKDIDNYIKRIFRFQKDLKNRRNQLVILCALTLLMNSVFAIMFASNDYFAGFETNIAFQVSNTVFIASVLITIALMLSKIHGKWLIEDISSKNQEIAERYYRIYRAGPKKVKPITYIMAAIYAVAGIFFFVKGHNIPAALVLMFVAGFTLMQPRMKVPNAKKQVKKYIETEFPTWLREVALNLRRKNVFNAINDTRENCDEIFGEHLDSFLLELEADPISIKPYNNFLAEYEDNDIKSTMKVLYSVSIIGAEQMPRQIDALIDRNQEMLQVSEEMKNKNNLGNVEMLGYVPMVLFSANMVVSMIILVVNMMAKINEMMVI